VAPVSDIRNIEELLTPAGDTAPVTASVEGLAADLRRFAEERDWGQFHTPKNLAMALAGEVGELVAEFQWLTAEESAAVMADRKAGDRVRAELGDVMIYLTRLADVLGIDLVSAARVKLADSAGRYPIEGSRGGARKAGT
jgi:NTP pyrophosphatase (non-canonical NTP hydrolase)